MKKNLKKKTLAEELVQYRGWLYERNLTVGDILRRVVAVAAGLVCGSMAFVGWVIVGKLGSMVTAGGGLDLGVASLFVTGLALLMTCGVLWLVWAIWTDEL